MYLFIILISIYAIASASRIPASQGRGEIPPTTSEEFGQYSTREINPATMTNHLQCTSCLTECDDIGKSAVSYYFCMKCLEDCGGNKYAMMHYFTTRKCHSVRTVPIDENVATVIPEQVLGELLWPEDPAEEPGNDFLDKYLQKQFSQPKSAGEQPENPSLISEYSSVQKQLGQCQKNLQVCNSQLAPPSYTYSYYDNEGSNYLSTGDEDFYGSYSPPVQSNKAQVMQKVFEKYSGRFTPKFEVDKLIEIQKKENKRKSLLKSKSPSEPMGLVCSSSFEIVVPVSAKHISGKFDVNIVAFAEFVQFFSQGACSKGKRPLVKLTPATVCDNVENVHLAVFYATREQIMDESVSLSSECNQADSETWICEGWIKLPGQCNLFLAPQQ